MKKGTEKCEQEMCAESKKEKKNEANVCVQCRKVDGIENGGGVCAGNNTLESYNNTWLYNWKRNLRTIFKSNSHCNNR